MSGGRRLLRRSLSVGAAGILAAAVAACSGVGGGYLPPGAPVGADGGPQTLFPTTVFSGRAPFGFTFSCQDRGGINRPTGKLSIELAYSDQGTSALATSPFSIHGIVDQIDPVLESMICNGQESPPGGNELIFLGRYRPTSSFTPAGMQGCPQRETPKSPLCRFEVIVRDNDGDLAPSKGDYFSITLSNATKLTSEFEEATVFYARGGLLAGGNVTVR